MLVEFVKYSDHKIESVNCDSMYYVSTCYECYDHDKLVYSIYDLDVVSFRVVYG